MKRRRETCQLLDRAMADRKTSAIFGAGTGPGGSITRFGREGDDTTYVGVDAVLSADVGDAPMRQRQYRAGRGDFCVEACGPRNPPAISRLVLRARLDRRRATVFAR